MKYTGSCHCKQVRFEVDAEIEKAMACNCSICAKRGSLLVFVPEEKFSLISGEDVLTDYQFGKRVIHHYFCSLCGILSFGAGSDAEGKKMRAINVRCLDDIDLDQISIHHFDGKSL
ncbi:MAG: GFA family protein [Candidatus Abawacabacteria bacterium]|nr:GFA family protein [Candidatus Abawacabacteria bacterium]